MAHVSNFTSGLCKWDGCTFPFDSKDELRRHLQEKHKVTTRHSAFVPEYCLEHPDLGWVLCEFEWEDHCRSHVDKACLTMNCNLERRFGTLVRDLVCPFCLSDRTLPFSKRYCTFSIRSHFNAHMDNCHFRKLRIKGPASCPHPLCAETPALNTLEELKQHFYDRHNLAGTGFTKSLGVSTKKRKWQSSELETTSEDESTDTSGMAAISPTLPDSKAPNSLLSAARSNVPEIKRIHVDQYLGASSSLEKGMIKDHSSSQTLFLDIPF
jgi:hypothetical protein